MLDTTTKRRIDTARDILVGKVPDPKSQVEQITIALIYKFMDDMDAEAEELGGERAFFTGDYARYGWAKLMAPSLGGHEMLGLYGEGISKMPENPGIPALFRDIFKNAYLPYRDPETLKAFLKIIDEFSYDHSERLGDAFEYLLSVLGSQGDAGQFRTPRHIIDFMVEVLAPQKNETILDPACGTAGFLISAYKHILRTNTEAKEHSTLTPDEKARLAKNFKGYDISPDMVRLSLVNLYLHGFTDPHIYEYDTLTSEDRWNEFADVILANPPFMSPKGGIKPHKRFSIQAKRSEVLFVDYMAEHLTPTGRAAIIVPEGIIFQSQTAYKHLRKMLVENSLVAVVSLPAGVFNPYAGVKTSILILDKVLSKRTDDILFLKIERDGTDLGARRKGVQESDLPRVLNAYHHWTSIVRAGNRHEQAATELMEPFLRVSKARIATDGIYNLTAERYRESQVATGDLFPIARIDSLTEEMTVRAKASVIDVWSVSNSRGFVRTGDYFDKQVASDDIANYKVVGPNCFAYNPSRLNVGSIALNTTAASGAVSPMYVVFRVRDDGVNPEYLFALLKSSRLNDLFNRVAQGGVRAQVRYNDLGKLQIPLPPLDVQKKIMVEIEGYQKVINGARAVLDCYRPHIPINANWPIVELGDVIKLSSGRGLTQSQMKVGPYIVYGGNGKNGMHAEYFVEAPNLVIGRVGAYCGAVHLTAPKAWVTDNALYVTEFKQQIDLKYLLQALVQLDLNQFAKVGGQPSISQTTVYERFIPLPPLATQQAIVAEIEAEQALVAANRELITRFERKIQATLARIWGEETPATPEA
jgi:type I restriction enzyme M protein